VNWVDQLAPGATRIPSPVRVNPYDVLDTFGAPTFRNDYVDNGDGILGMGDWISGSGTSDGQGRTYFGGGGSDASPASQALAAALMSQQGKVAAAQRRAAAGLAGLEAFAQNPGPGPSIGGYGIDTPQALPFLQALGLGGQRKSLEEEERERQAKAFANIGS
jgi:hypothetical protein